MAGSAAAGQMDIIVHVQRGRTEQCTTQSPILPPYIGPRARNQTHTVCTRVLFGRVVCVCVYV